MSSSDRLEDGVYLNLPFEDYIAQDAMGSTDWSMIDKLKLGWWWQSRHNPRRKVPKINPFQNYGSALHAIMLEGVEAYEARFAVQPDKASYGDRLVETVEDMKKALADEGYDLSGSSKFAKAQWGAAMRQYLPEVPCWMNLEADFVASLGDRKAIKSDEDWAIRFMRDMALDPARNDNAAIRRLLEPKTGQPPLVEVSVFATVDGIRRRWRFDRLFPGATGDLKSLGSWRGRPLQFEAGEVLAQNRWPIQRADYETGREIAYEFIGRGQLHGGDLDQRRFIERIAAEEPDWFWLWLVYQKPHGAGTPPVLMPIHNARGSYLHGLGQEKLNHAITFYLNAVDEFGIDRPWGRVEELHYTDEKKDGPQISYPHWISHLDPVERNAYGEPDEESQDE